MIEEVKDQYMVQSTGSQLPQNRTFRVSARLIPERSMQSTSMAKTLKDEGLQSYHEKDSTQMSIRNEANVSKMTFNQLLRKSATRNRTQNNRTPVSQLKVKVQGVSQFNEPTSAKDNLSISSNSTANAVKRVSFRTLVKISGNQSNNNVGQDQKELINNELQNSTKDQQLAIDQNIEQKMVNTSQFTASILTSQQAYFDKTNTSQVLVNSQDPKTGSNNTIQEQTIQFTVNAHEQVSVDQAIQKDIENYKNFNFLQDTTNQPNQIQKVKTNEHIKQKKSVDLQIVDFQILPEQNQAKTPTNQSPHQNQSNRILFSNVKTENNLKTKWSQKKVQTGQNHFIQTKSMIQPSNGSLNKTPTSSNEKGQQMQHKKIQNPSTPIGVYQKSSKFKNDFPLENYNRRGYLNLKKSMTKTPRQSKQIEIKKNQINEVQIQNQHFASIQPTTFQRKQQQTENKVANLKKPIRMQALNISQRPNNLTGQTGLSAVGQNQNQNSARTDKSHPLNVRSKQSLNSRIPSIQPKRHVDFNVKGQSGRQNYRSNTNSTPERGSKTRSGFSASGDQKILKSKESTPEKNLIRKMTIVENNLPVQLNQIENNQAVQLSQIDKEQKDDSNGNKQSGQSTFEQVDKQNQDENKVKNNLIGPQIEQESQIQSIKEDIKQDVKSKQKDNESEVKKDEQLNVDTKLNSQQTNNQQKDNIVFEKIETLENVDEKFAQKMVHYQSQDLLKDDSNMKLEGNERDNELIKEQQHNSMMVELNQVDEENSLNKNHTNKHPQIMLPPQDMISWQSPHIQSLNILQKDNESNQDTVKTPHLPNFAINSPGTGTSFKKDDINGTLGSQSNLNIISNKQSLNTINCNDSGMNIQENPYSGQSSVMQSFQKDLIQSSEFEQKRLDETLKDEESIMNKIQPQLLNQNLDRNVLFEPISPTKLSVVPELKPLKGFDEVIQKSKNSTNVQQTHQSFINQQQVNPQVQTDQNDIQNNFSPIIEQNQVQQETNHEVKREYKAIQQNLDLKVINSEKPSNDEKYHQQVEIIKKLKNKDNSESEEENTQNLMAEMNASFSSKLFKQNFNVQQQLQQRSHSPTRPYIKQYQKQGNKSNNEPTTPKVMSNTHEVNQFDDVCKSNQNFQSVEPLIHNNENQNHTNTVNNDNEIIIEIIKPDMKNNLIIIKEPLENQQDIKLNQRYQIKDESPELNENKHTENNLDDNIQNISEKNTHLQQKNVQYQQNTQDLEVNGCINNDAFGSKNSNQQDMQSFDGENQHQSQSDQNRPIYIQEQVHHQNETNFVEQQVQETVIDKPIEIEENKPKMKILNLKELMCPETYNLSFSIKYKVNYGEQIAIVGNIKQLGNWTNTSKAMLQWTEGDIWVLKNMQIQVDNPQSNTSNGIQNKKRGSFNFFDSSPKRQNEKKIKHYFQYKYVVIDSHSRQIVRIEKGPNRLADLNLKYFEAFEQQIFVNDQEKNDYVDYVLSTEPSNLIYHDQWETISVNFSMYYPINEGEVLRIFGDTLQLGNWSCKIQGYQDKPGELEAKLMNPMSKQIPWLTGELVTPFEYSVTFNLQNMPHRLKYKYSVQNNIVNRTVWEREPTREIQLKDPNDYQGQLGNERSNLWRNVFPVYIVNGHIEKADANFVGDMRFDQIGKTNIWLGQYPQTEEDIDLLKEAGLTGVFNVQTDGDLSFRGVNQKLMMKYYKEVGINAVHFPIQDFNEHELTSKLFEAAKILNDMINNKGLKVYVHCTAGMGRAPASVVCYLCLFKKVQGWQDPYHVDKLVKNYRKVSVPNMNAVCNVINANRDYQNQQHENTVE